MYVKVDKGLGFEESPTSSKLTVALNLKLGFIIDY